ncbi:MAG: hypothetical protein H7835_11615 [Magnetococcus sp. XQGC-1]
MDHPPVGDPRSPGSATGPALTLLLSRGEWPVDWQAAIGRCLPQIARLDLFCTLWATRLINENFAFLPPGRRVFCAHTQQRLGGAPLAAGSPFVAGGLATLGRMVRESHAVLSLPHLHCSGVLGEEGVKNIGIILGEEPEFQKEAIRLATGLAGCNHAVTLYTPTEPEVLRLLSPETASLLEALLAMQAEFKIASAELSPGNHGVLLQL